MTALNPRHQRFIEEYLVDLNATRAYKVAYPKVKSDETAAANGARLLGNAKVADAIRKAQQERAARLGIVADDVVRGLHAEATRLGEGASHSARVQAWGLLGRHLGMFTDRVETVEPVHKVITLEVVDGSRGQPVDSASPARSCV